MIDPQRLAAFALVTAATSLVPGPSMLFVMSQAIWRGARAGWLALLGMQIGYIGWWLLAALGLGTLAAAYPTAFRVLALLGALYLAWLGLSAIRHAHRAARAEAPQAAPDRRATGRPFRDGIVVALGNPKSLVYIVALVPPFVSPGQGIAPQIAMLALVAMAIDLVVGALYIGLGSRLSAAMEDPRRRRWIDTAIGLLFLAIAAAIVVQQWPA